MNSLNHLNYRVLGNGHPVVFLHGFLESISMWENFKLETAPFKSVLIDLPGHGKSPLLDDSEKPSLEFMAEMVKELIDFLQLDNYHVVGHSMGGYVALLLKEMDPKCSKVVLMNSNFWEDSTEKKRDRIRVADIVLKAKSLFVQEAIPGLFYRHDRQDKVVTELLKEAQKMEAAAIAYASLAMRNRKNNHPLLKKYPNDFLLIQGMNDPLISVEKMKEEIGEIKVSLCILNDTGHMSQIEEPEKTLKAIVEFLG